MAGGQGAELGSQVRHLGRRVVHGHGLLRGRTHDGGRRSLSHCGLRHVTPPVVPFLACTHSLCQSASSAGDFPADRRTILHQHSITFTASPPREVSLYFVFISAPVSRIVLITLSSET